LVPSTKGVLRIVAEAQHFPPLHELLGHIASLSQLSPVPAKQMLARHGASPVPQSLSASHFSPALHPPFPQQTPFPQAP
jgi:hypothetical protein